MQNGSIQHTGHSKFTLLTFLIEYYTYIVIDVQIHQVKVPLLIAHGEDDELVPPIHGQILYEASGTTQSPIFVAGVGHNNLENSEKLWKRVKHFLYK